MLPRMLLLAGLAAGCGGTGTAPAVPTPAAEECLLRSGDSTAAGPLLAAARGDDTLLLAPARRHTLIGLSCAGRPVPRVATSWSADSSRTTWTLLLPSAAEIAARWRERPDAAAALRAAGVMSVVPLDQRRLAVTFGTPRDEVPFLFADPALGAPADFGADTSSIRLLAGGDLRDALDRGAALVVTSDPAVLEYGSGRPEVTAHPLPWNRTYVLLAPGGEFPLGGVGLADSARFRQGLARDVVREAARAAQPPFWWEHSAGCARATDPGPAPSPIVIYPGDDPVARALAERMVAMAEAPGAVARGVPAGRLAAALAGGFGSLYIVPLPRVPLVPCRELAAWPEGATAVPLIETRLTALLRAGAPPVRVDYDGALLPADRP